jgi:hypothetical protein
MLAEHVTEPPYNYDHFTRQVVWLDGAKTIDGYGVPPGALAPDFELPDTDGNLIRLSDQRGRPVLLHFGSYS